ncbi:hypothetical protein Q5P01_001448 [Channa striata]|uniref:Shisa N-terminal domain-containing protein n=1 Tax=Channa striata TaxID=64152 RepID=A0AA88NPD2_CHASR|nr:hypothetical protein Q5P01_001448 [Channa striata]
MAGMVPSVLSTVVLCVVLLPAVWGVTYSCSSFLDKDTKQCGSKYCCGNCNNKYCCSEKKYQLTQQQQEQCLARSSPSIALMLGVIFGSIFAITSCVGLVICCVTPCCLIHRKFQERRNQRQQTQRLAAGLAQYQLYPPGYQSVPVQTGFGDPPLPTAPPPSYQEATDPANFPPPFTHGHPMDSFQPPGQSNAPSSHLAEYAQRPYNPSYGTQTYPG